MHWTPGDARYCAASVRQVVELAFLAVPDEIQLHPRAGPPTGEQQVVLAMTRPWCKRPPASWRHHGIGRAADAPTSPTFPSALPGRLLIPQGPDGTRQALVHSTLSLAGARKRETVTAAWDRTISAADPTPEPLAQTDRGRGRDVETLAPPDASGCARWSAKAAVISADNPCFGPEQP